MANKILCRIIGFAILLSFVLITAQAADEGYKNVTIKEIFNKSSDYVGKGVTIDGKITQECDMRGCWLTVDDGTGVVLVDLAPNNFTIPLNQVGNTAKVFGTVKLVEGKKFLTFEPGSPYIIGNRVEISGTFKSPLVSTTG